MSRVGGASSSLLPTPGFRGFILLDRSLSRFAYPLMDHGMRPLLLPLRLRRDASNPDLIWILAGRLVLTDRPEDWHRFMSAYQLSVVALPRGARETRWVPALLRLLDTSLGATPSPRLFMPGGRALQFREGPTLPDLLDPFALGA